MLSSSNKRMEYGRLEAAMVVINQCNWLAALCEALLLLERSQYLFRNSPDLIRYMYSVSQPIVCRDDTDMVAGDSRG